MRKILIMLIAPTLSMLILTLGNGFFTTITTLALKDLHGSALLIGIVASGYFLGLMWGSYRSSKLINRVGHIRAYAVFATMMTVGSLLQGIFSSAILWFFLRLITGYALAGLFIVIESWLLARSDESNKGRILAFYLLIYYLAQAASQLLLKVPYQSTLVAFVMIAVLASVSIIPVSVTRFSAPEVERQHLTSMRELWKLAPLGIWAAFIAGTILGVIYAMYPLVLKEIHLATGDIAYIMAATVLGGAALQVPIGKLSDHVDRRKVIFLVCVLTLVVSVLALMLPKNIWTLLIVSFLLGGLSFTFYPLSISHASDYLSTNQAVAVIAMLTLLYGVGSAIGPIVLPAFMKIFGPYGFYVYMGIVVIVLGLYTGWRLTRREPAKDTVAFVSTVPETGLAAEEIAEQLDVPTEQVAQIKRKRKSKG